MKKGDHVIYDGRHPARIIFTMPGKIRIKFTDTNLIPPKMTVPEESLTLNYNYLLTPRYDSEFECPDCGFPWKETQVVFRKYYDCPKCGKKKEDFV